MADYSTMLGPETDYTLPIPPVSEYMLPISPVTEYSLVHFFMLPSSPGSIDTLSQDVLDGMLQSEIDELSQT